MGGYVASDPRSAMASHESPQTQDPRAHHVLPPRAPLLIQRRARQCILSTASHTPCALYDEHQPGLSMDEHAWQQPAQGAGAPDSAQIPYTPALPMEGRAWQPPAQGAGAPGTLMASRSNCQYARRVTGALHLTLELVSECDLLTGSGFQTCWHAVLVP